MLTRKISFMGLISVFLPGFALGGQAIPNWSAPATWSPARRHGGLTTMGDVTNPLPFIGADPCRIADTRNPPGPYGAPSMPGGSPRNFTLTGVCGIPASALAVSLNVTVTNTQGPGFILIWPAGGMQPNVSTLNYVAGQTIANAAVVPLGTGGAVTVIAGVSGTDLILDMNGYYEMSINSGESFEINGSRSGGGVIFGQNSQNADNSSGVNGEELAISGKVYGVEGISFSTTGKSAGIRGEDSSLYEPTGFVETAGVLGTSRASLGVWGQSRNIGVVGQLLNTSDVLIAYGLLGSSFGTAADATGPPWGVFSAGNFGATGSKHFVEPHPTDPQKAILYSTVEGRTVDTTFRGTARLIDHTAMIEVPEDFRMVTDEEGVTVQITPVGAYSQIYIESQDLNRIVIRGSKDVVFYYQVTGLRRAFKDLQPVQTSYVFMPQSSGDRMPAYLTDEAKRRLIANGTYNTDGTVNMETAERLGWTKMWADREEQARAAAAANAAHTPR